MSSLRSPGQLLVVALALGWSVDLLFYGKFLGVSMLLFVFLLMVALFRLGRLEEESPNWRSWPSFHLARQRAYVVLLENQSLAK